MSASSITVKSDDGYTATYSVDDNTLVDAGNNGIADVMRGDAVRVTGVVSGGKTRAVELFDATRIEQLNGRWMPPFPG